VATLLIIFFAMASISSLFWDIRNSYLNCEVLYVYSYSSFIWRAQSNWSGYSAFYMLHCNVSFSLLLCHNFIVVAQYTFLLQLIC